MASASSWYESQPHTIHGDYVITHSFPEGGDPNYPRVLAHHRESGDLMGFYDFQPVWGQSEDGRLKAVGFKGWDVMVHHQHRRKGIASAMRNHAKQHLGPVRPGDFQTEEGQAFLATQKRELNLLRFLPLKKAISDLKPGQPHQKWGILDYSHLLSPEQREQGYQLLVLDQHNGLPGKPPYTKVSVHHPSQEAPVGSTHAYQYQEWHDAVSPDFTFLHQDHRDRGLGKAMYEALFVHAKHKLGKTRVKGMGHTEAASRVHAALARKHGLGYEPTVGQPYEYMLKNEGAAYPLADPPEYAHSDYQQKGGRIAYMHPDQFLALAKPLELDDAAEDNIQDLAGMMQTGRKLDPALLIVQGSQVIQHDGRHRAEAAKRLGIARFPVLILGHDQKPVPEGQLLPQMKKAEKKPTNLQGNLASEAALDMLGFRPLAHSAFAAARFLVGGKKLTLEQVRRALWNQDGDLERAALEAYQIPIDETNLRALRGVQKLKDFQKAEHSVAPPEELLPATPSASEAAEEIHRAFQDGEVVPVHLDGKHSKGSLLARDSKSDNVYLLKPDAGGESPAAGEDQEHSPMAAREAAFWHIADALGLGDSIPRAELITMGRQPWAAIKMLPWNYRSLMKVWKTDQPLVLRILGKYLQSGLLHKWAALDYICGNTDRHGNNLMLGENTILLIDQGSSFAGEDFDPAHDRKTFIPFYLRAWTTENFNALSPKERLKRLPTLPTDSEDELKEWIRSIEASRLEATLKQYGIDPEPTLARLAKVKLFEDDAAPHLNELWVL